ncbi:MAG: MupG family TIM beta-alpha barrel fold protein, partial [Atopostipes sp.]|nr:MupG family TIM beta-alpha barrel fold protein [Atopostipes sp.]
NKYRKIIEYGNSLGMKTTLDINPRLFDQLDISYNDLSFFAEIGADSIRLDLGFNGSEEALMTKNKYGLKIEVNMSSGTKYVDNVMSYQPDRTKLIASHNFYPMRYAGLSREHFDKTTSQFNKYNLNTSAFITSQEGEIGPWSLQTGLCTLEAHRDLSLDTQVTHYKLMDNIDDLIIGNAYASEEELKRTSKAFFSPHVLISVNLEDDISDLEKKLVLEELHTYRGDHSEYLLRSTQTRVKYKKEDFPVRKINSVRAGDVTIGNNNFRQYKGETQIILKNIKYEGYRNVVGEITEDMKKIIKDLKPWTSFKMVKAQ